MPFAHSPSAMADRIQQLLKERNVHADAIARIDSTLAKVSSALGAPIPGRRGRKPGIPNFASMGLDAPRRRGRGHFATTAEETIISFVRSRKNPTTQDINKHWRSEGRGHTADNTLTKMVKEKKLKRDRLKEGRGSSYSLP